MARQKCVDGRLHNSRRNLTAAAWRPIVELTRRRHLKFRRRLEARTQGAKGAAALAAVVVAAGV